MLAAALDKAGRLRTELDQHLLSTMDAMIDGKKDFSFPHYCGELGPEGFHE
jgi:hypothetical protein